MTTFSLVIDDSNLGPWSSYEQDLQQYLAQCFAADFKIYRISDRPQIASAISGWWRQQLIKLTVDDMLEGDEWFVVDGDVIFDTLCDIKGVTPVSRKPELFGSATSVLSINYVEHCLGIDQGYFQHQGQYSLTNPIPFRWVDRELLQGLRQTVSDRFDQDFVDLHLQWFRDQTIVAFEDPPVRMLMTEWELIELYRHRIKGDRLPLLDIGSGYPIYTHTAGLYDECGIFRHGFVRDAQMYRPWFEAQNLNVSDDLWQKARDWIVAVEPHRRPI